MPPIFLQQAHQLPAGRAEDIISTRAGAFDIPLALQQALLFQASEQWVQNALFDLPPVPGAVLDQSLALLGFQQLAERRQHQDTAAQFLSELIVQIGKFILFHCVWHYTVYYTVLSSE